MATQESTLQISGMTCSACAARVQKGVNKLDGVEQANVNFPLDQLTVQYNPKETGIDDFKKEVEKNGYVVVEVEAELDVSGMSCSYCSQTVEKGINDMDGVVNANVNFPLEQLTVQYNPKETGIDDFKKEVEKNGYGVVEAEAEFDVSGMTCANCSQTVEKGLNNMDGVFNANVNLALETVSVNYNEKEVQIDDMVDKVKQLGYELIPQVDGEEKVDHKEKEIKNQKNKFIFSAILTFPLLWTMFAHFDFLSFIYVPDIFMNPWFQLILATPVQFVVGAQFYKGAYKSLKNKSANMDVLVALGTSAAYFYSIYLGIEWMNAGSVGYPDLYFEAAAVIITLIVLGKLFEVRAKR